MRSLQYYAAPLLMRKAHCSWMLSDFEVVVADTGRVIRARSDDTAALELRGRAYYRLAELSMAANHFKEALKHDPDHAAAREGFHAARAVQKQVREFTVHSCHS